MRKIGGIMDKTTQEILEEILERIDEEVFDKLNDGGDDWFAADKISEVKDIIKEYIEE